MKTLCEESNRCFLSRPSLFRLYKICYLCVYMSQLGQRQLRPIKQSAIAVAALKRGSWPSSVPSSVARLSFTSSEPSAAPGKATTACSSPPASCVLRRYPDVPGTVLLCCFLPFEQDTTTTSNSGGDFCKDLPLNLPGPMSPMLSLSRHRVFRLFGRAPDRQQNREPLNVLPLRLGCTRRFCDTKTDETATPLPLRE